MKGARVSVAEAAPVLGMTPDKLRYELRQKHLADIGEAIPRGRGRNGKQRYSYHVYAPKVLARVGLTEWPGGDRE